MNVGPVQLLIIALVILILFGRGRISEMMGDFGKGVKSFRQGMNDDASTPPPAQISAESRAAPESTESAPADKTAN